MFDFSGKVAVVTGAASGIGRATTELFLAGGASVVGGDIDAEALAALKAELDPDGARLEVQAYDAASSASADALIALAMDRCGALDHLALCAGVYRQHPLKEMTDANWRQTISVNLDGAFYLIRAAAQVMAPGSSIVTLASVAAHKGGTYGFAHYGASKGGILALTRSAAQDLAPDVRVNCVSPGLIETPMTVDLVQRLGEDIRKQILLGRYGKPSEIASVVGFLCSDAASFVNGEVIIASGGAYMG
ncbi:SDR family NAD(P)-dependent oxidoreductase [Allosediminivita pacifica]|uniref:3-oxoacyl-[acyl-carrier protein] reductase n=1 Tax=Allosediminivita pacifica TaxID=1267769 RepID=A0A2T6A7I6_9RHOB|nr:SDR family NAD(P)-dependent oxidoreductase [Allosediminivita pacifica]PTX39789.1 3-oxoacyl-[acyl-carrier protein] reductase [Allosediminivita pacifica]GGB27173.1 short-chain dehydrogenase [Allosediminivita pacifica]